MVLSIHPIALSQLTLSSTAAACRSGCHVQASDIWFETIAASQGGNVTSAYLSLLLGVADT